MRIKTQIQRRELNKRILLFYFLPFPLGADFLASFCFLWRSLISLRKNKIQGREGGGRRMEDAVDASVSVSVCACVVDYVSLFVQNISTVTRARTSNPFPPADMTCMP